MGQQFLTIIGSPNVSKHDPKYELSRGALKDYSENPKRVRNLEQAILSNFSLPSLIVNEHLPLEVFTQVHNRQMIAELTRLHELSCLHDKYIYPFPEKFLTRFRPEIVEWLQKNGSMSINAHDTSAPVGPYTIRACGLQAAMVMASESLLNKNPEAMVLLLNRPPGHHAGVDTFGSFCYTNTGAFAASLFSKRGKAGILDIDFHHGNGTQEICRYRENSIYCSIHRRPLSIDSWYPYTGDENNPKLINLPLVDRASEESWIKAVKKGISNLTKCSINSLVVSIGFDVLSDDPYSTFDVTPSAFEAVGRMIRQMSIPVLLTLEGGYGVSSSTACVSLIHGLTEK